MNQPDHTQEQTKAAATPMSLCIVTNQLNEKLQEIIAAANPFFDEILIGYDGNMDIHAHNFSGGLATVIPVQWEGYSITKNKLADRAANTWILSLDGDEVPDNRLLEEFRALQRQQVPEQYIYTFRRISFMEGKPVRFGAWGKDKVIRLYNKAYTHWQHDIVHERLALKEGTRIVLLKGTLWHYTAESYAAFLEKNKKYARLSAEKYFSKGKKSPLWKRICSPVFTFIKEYIFQLGFLDGIAGYRVAKINAMYTYWKYRFLKDRYQASN